jgi:ribokinase
MDGLLPRARMNVCVVGSTMVDLVTRVPRLPVAGETLAGSSFSEGFGGKGGNQAVTAARLGADTTLVGRIGADRFGDAALANYLDAGVDARFVTRDPALPTGVAPIFVDDAGQNCIAIVLGANAALTKSDVGAAAVAIAAADVVVCQLEIPQAAVIEAFRIARGAGVTTIFNPAPAAPVADELWGLTSIAVPNETEAELLTGIAIADDASAEAAARALLARGAGAVIVTLGRRGALVVTAGGSERIAPVNVSAVDTTGAGDAFVGTLAACLSAGMTLGAAARRANLVAACSVTRAGTQTSFPDRATAIAFAAGHDVDLLPAAPVDQ